MARLVLLLSAKTRKTPFQPLFIIFFLLVNTIQEGTVPRSRDKTTTVLTKTKKTPTKTESRPRVSVTKHSPPSLSLSRFKRVFLVITVISIVMRVTFLYFGWKDVTGLVQPAQRLSKRTWSFTLSSRNKEGKEVQQKNECAKNDFAKESVVNNGHTLRAIGESKRLTSSLRPPAWVPRWPQTCPPGLHRRK